MKKDKDGYTWITIYEATQRCPIEVSHSTIRRWVTEGKYGVIGAKFAGRLMVREDTLPKIEHDF